MTGPTKQTRFGEELTLEVGPTESEGSSGKRFYDTIRSLPARGLDLVLKSSVVSWIAPKFTWTNLKPVIRSTVSAWISLIFLILPKTERIMGQASFFILISAFLSPPSMPFAAVLEKELANNLFVLVAWAWSSLAIRLSMLPRREVISNPDIISVFSGRYIEAWPTVICGVFLFLGTAFFAYLKARLGPGQYTVATIFGSLTLLTSLTISPLFPYANYTAAESIVIPLAIHAAITLTCSLLVFPQSVNAQFTKRLSSCLSSLLLAIKTQPTLLTITPFSEEFNLDDFRSHLTAAEAGLPLLAASARLMKRDISFGRFAGTDLKQLHSFGRQLFVRGEGVSFFFKIIDPLRDKFPDTPHGSRFGTPLLTPAVSRPETPTTPASGRGSVQYAHSPLCGDDGRLPDSPVASSAASSLHRRKGRGLHGPLSHLRHLLDEFSHPHEDPVGAFETQKYMNLETHFDHPQSQFHLERALGLLHESCSDLLTASADGLQASVTWLENVNASRFRPVRIFGGGVKREDQSAEVRAAHAKLSETLTAFRISKRLLVLSPYQAYLDVPEHMPPHRFLFQSFVYQFHLTEFASVLCSLLEELLRLDAERPSSRIWWPVLPFSSIIKSMGESWEVQESTANHEQQEEDPDRIPGIQAPIAYDLGEARPRNPDAYPPSNPAQMFISMLADGVEALWRGNSLFAIKTAVLTILLSLPAFIKSSAEFAYVHRAIWAIFIGQVNLARFRGDTIYGFFARLGATFFGGVTGLVIWYTSTGTGTGNPYGLAAVCAVYFPLAFYMLLWSPLHPATNMIFHATVALVIGYSWQDTNLQLPASPGFGWDVAWRRFILVAIGVTAAFILSFLPPSTSIRGYQRLSHSTTTLEIGAIYCCIVSLANSPDSEHEDATEIVTRLTALRAKLNRMHALRANIKFEASVHGHWPSERYAKLHDLQMEITALLSQLLSVVQHLDVTWTRAFMRRTRFVEPEFLADILAALTMISTALRTARPLPQLTPVLLEQFWRVQPTINVGSAVDENSRAPRNMTPEVLADEQYMYFCVGVSSAHSIITRIDRLMLATKELVGEHYHIHGLKVNSPSVNEDSVTRLP